MNKLAIIICLFTGIGAFGQTSEIDSLLALYPETSNEQRVELLHNIVKASWTTEPNVAIKYGREAIALSKELENLKLLSISYRLFGGLYNYMSLIDSGRYYKSQALNIALQLNDSLLIASTYNNLGVSAQTVGNYVEALNYYYLAYLMGRHLNDFAGFPIVICNISEVYFDIAEYDSAAKYAQEAVSKTISTPNTSRHLLAKNWLARTNLAQGNTNVAEASYRSIIKIGEKIGEKRYTAYANQGLGRLNLKVENYELARQYFTKAHQLFKQLDDQTYIAEIYWDLSKLNKKSHPDSARYFARKSLAIANSLDLSDLVLLNYQNLIELFTANRNIDSIQYYYSQFKQLEEAKQKENNRHGIEGVFAKIQEEQTRNQMAEQSLRLQQKTFQTNFMIALAVITLFFAGFIFRYYKKQKRFSVHLEEVNRQIARQNDLIDKKNKDLEALNNEKDNLINIVAHDLKNPLTSIIGSTQVVQEIAPQDDETIQKMLEIIEGSARRLSKMISKILDVNSIEKGLPTLELTSVNLTEVLGTNCEELESRAREKKIKIHPNLADQVIILGEQTYVYQVLENLISNAIKFSPTEKNIYVNLTTQNGSANVEIKDEGPGISKEDQALLFQKFQKLSALPTGGESSTGLGLSIVKKFMEAMNGEVWCESEYGNGASFHAKFQLAK